MTSGDQQDESLASRKAALFRQLGSSTPIRILEYLSDGAERTAMQLAVGLYTDSGDVRGYVTAMHDYGLLTARGEGAGAVYRADDPRIFQLLELATEVLASRSAATPPDSDEPPGTTA